MNTMMKQQYFLKLAAAYVRGMSYTRQAQYNKIQAGDALFSKSLEELSEDEQQTLVESGLERGLRLHRFKRTMGLPRVRRVLGILASIQPVSLLDIGSGRGAFLWPLLDAFPYLPVTCVDMLEHRVAGIQAVRDGGVQLVDAFQGDVTRLPCADKSFDVVTMLEVLEHIPQTERAIAEICRVAQRFVVLTMPSRPDNNPEHIHLFDETRVRKLLAQAGVKHINVEFVPNHMVVVASMEQV